jgi:hypothetical protein
MLCHALINREEGVGLPKTLGKKRLFECGFKMTKRDKYTLICPAGHKRMTDEWDKRSFAAFYSSITIKKVR